MATGVRGSRERPGNSQGLRPGAGLAFDRWSSFAAKVERPPSAMTKSQNHPAKPGVDPAVTGTRLTEAAPESMAAGHLKVVTVAPATQESHSATGPSSPSDPYLGATVDGRYLVEAVLGEGGMGIVYRCTHTIIGKKVAMKVLRADLARDSEVTERFLNEARAASAIGNPHIIDISDFGQFPDRATYFVMEHLTGAPLSKLLEGNRALPLARILHIARQLCSGLSAAHAAGIVHRDLKPDNIFLIRRGAEHDFVKILDFGIAKTNAATRLTRDGAVFGTPHYMSPEQAAGNPVDQRGDVYALGVILYEMACGKVPFDADSFMGILTQHLYKAPIALSRLEPPPPELSPGLDAIVLKCLSKRPEDRYPDMLALDADLERLALGSEPLALREMLERSQAFDLPGGYFERPPAERGKRRVRNLALLGLSALGLVAAIVFFARRDPAPSTSRPSVLGEPTGAAAPVVAAPVVVPDQALPRAPASKQVVLAVEPLDAHVFRAGVDLGASPVVVEVREGERIDLKIRREGYAEGSIALDGARAREIVKLSPLARGPAPRPPARPKAPPTATKTAPKNLSGGEIVNPWK
jgi:serine/threonine-protein kinase